MKTMQPISVSESIVPVGEFKTQISRHLKRLIDGAGPLVITQNGRAAGVVLSPAEYDRMCDRERFFESLLAGAGDADAGRVMDTATLRERLAERRAERSVA
jgi:prevent-host-death family protein